MSPGTSKHLHRGSAGDRRLHPAVPVPLWRLSFVCTDCQRHPCPVCAGSSPPPKPEQTKTHQAGREWRSFGINLTPQVMSSERNQWMQCSPKWCQPRLCPRKGTQSERPTRNCPPVPASLLSGGTQRSAGHEDTSRGSSGEQDSGKSCSWDLCGPFPIPWQWQGPG